MKIAEAPYLLVPAGLTSTTSRPALSDYLRASIDRLQGLVAEVPRLDLPARPDANVR